MSDYFDSFDCQVQCEEVYWVDPCVMAPGEEKKVSDEELAVLINSLPF